jgi:RNA polymerase sigma-70 factor, ECF subfamily
MDSNSGNPAADGNDLLTELRIKVRSDREIFASLQRELRIRAAAKMSRERVNHTLGATALINEAYLRIFKKDSSADGRWADEHHALNAISLAMERILLDHADSHQAEKRGGKAVNRVPLDQAQAGEWDVGDRRGSIDEGLLVRPEQSEEIVAVHEAIARLSKISERQAKVVQLQFFGGLTQDEIAAVLDVSVETVKLDWRKARGYLRLSLAQGAGGG